MQEKHKETEFSDIDLKQWKQYNDVLVETLWLLGPRDKTEPHAGDYWGNFIPQIPYQVLTRFTKRNHVVVDFFSGMATTLIECRRLGRHGIGVEIDPAVARRSIERVASAPNPYNVHTDVLIGDSTAQETIDRVTEQLATLGASRADCVILHPPYHDIIAFSGIEGDLSRAASTEAFLEQFSRVATRAYGMLKQSGFMARSSSATNMPTRSSFR
ncbi:MAG: DNA methyltransferase [Halobacteriota archaeon]